LSEKNDEKRSQWRLKKESFKRKDLLTRINRIFMNITTIYNRTAHIRPFQPHLKATS